MQNLKVSNLNELRFTAPDCLMNRDGECLTVSKKTLKNLMSSLGLVGDKFSKDLYDIDESVWSELVQKKCEASAYYNENSVIIANGEVINVVSNNNREWLLKLEGILKERAKHEDLDVQTLREEDGFSVLCTGDNLGYVISVVIPDKQIIVQNVYLTPDGLVCISPSTQVNCKIDSGVNCSDLLSLLDHDVLMGATCAEEYKNYYDYIGKTHLSYFDCLEALKAIFNLRVKSTIPAASDYLNKLDANSFATEEIDFARMLLEEIYQKAYHYIPTVNQLEKHLKFVSCEYRRFIQVLSSRYLGGNLDYKVLAKFSAQASDGNLDESVVSRVFGRELE